MKKIRIIADDKIPFLKESPLAEIADMAFLPGAEISKNELMNADAVITRTRTKCNESTLSGTPVKAIATATIGFDHIDTDYCRAQGIEWKNAPGCNAASVAQYITSLLICHALRRRISLCGKTLGVIGAGNVGKKVIRAAEALGMRVLVNDPPRAEAEGNAGFCSLETIRNEADIITFHVPLTKEGRYTTRHLADEAFLRSLRPETVLINTSRGAVVDNAALKKILRENVISGAALDVWENEPEIDLELMDLLDFATPHIAGYSTDGKANGTAASIRFIADFFGLPDLDTWYPEVPRPENTDLEVRTPADAVLASYDIRKDDRALRMSPGTFEKQRGDYPLRREFPVFRIVNGDELTPELRTTLKNLGFESGSFF